MDLENSLGLWIKDTSTVRNHLHDIQNLGFEYLIARVVVHNLKHGLTLPYEPDILQQIISDANSIEMPVICWAYVYPNLSLANQISVIASTLPPSCTDLIIDAEAEWETDPDRVAKANDLAHGLAQATSHRVGLHLSSFYAPDLHLSFPFHAFLNHCQSFMPQSYVNGTDPEVVLSRTLKQAKPLAQHDLAKLFLPTVNGPQILSLLLDSGVRGSSVYVWEDTVRGREGAWAPVISKFASL